MCIQYIEGEKGFQPPVKYQGKRLLDRFSQDSIRQKIYEMYSGKEHVTLDKLLPILRDADLFDGQRTVLKEILKDMGFGYKKRKQKALF